WSYNRPDAGKVDTPYLQTHASQQAPRAWWKGSRAPMLGRISSYTIQVLELPLDRIDSRSNRVPKPLLDPINSRAPLAGHLEKVFWGGRMIWQMLTWPPHHRALGQLARRRGQPDAGSRSDASMGGVSGRTADLTQVRSTLLTCRRTPHSKHQGHGGKARGRQASSLPQPAADA
ncbi:hypothetical protein BHE74_00039111, partial [Ensete ventricosum]